MPFFFWGWENGWLSGKETRGGAHESDIVAWIDPSMSQGVSSSDSLLGRKR